MYELPWDRIGETSAMDVFHEYSIKIWTFITDNGVTNGNVGMCIVCCTVIASITGKQQIRTHENNDDRWKSN